MKITSRSIQTVKPAVQSPTSGSTIPLSNIDQIVPRLYTRFLLFFSNSLSNSLPTNEALDKSLSRTLTIFNPLAGRYKLLPDGSLELHCTDDGAEFITASTDFQLKDFNNFQQHDPRFADLGPCGRSPAEDITRAPLLLIQLTRFSCGGSSLVVALHHNIADGYSMSSFIKAWSQISSGEDPSSVETPCFDHSLLAARPDPQRQHTHTEYQTVPPSVPAIFPELQVRVFRFSSRQLHLIRAGCRPGATRFEAMAGHIWRFVTKARGLQSHQDTKLGFPVDGRARLNPPLPRGYFGNAIFYTYAASRVEELVNQPTSYAASLVHEAVDRMTDEYMRSTLDWIEQQERPLKVFPAIRKAESDLSMTSWSKFPLYEADFGCGKPVFVGLPVAAFTGQVIFMPSPPADDSLTVLVGLYAEHMNNLLADPFSRA